MTAETNLLEVRGLEVTFPIPGREVRACQNVDLAIAPGQIHAVVGESGSGKTMLARSTLRLLPPPALITAGATVISWVLVSAFHLTLVEPRTVFFQYLLTLGVFPAVAWLFLRWQRAFLRLD